MKQAIKVAEKVLGYLLMIFGSILSLGLAISAFVTFPILGWPGLFFQLLASLIFAFYVVAALDLTINGI